MGCDIHMVLERRQRDAEWVGIWSSDVTPGEKGRVKVGRRDYAFFSEVAQVRGSSPTGHYPRNLPIDVSRLAWLQYMSAPTDHHSPSHLSLEEFIAAWLRANDGDSEVRANFAAHDLFSIDAEWPEGCEYRVVFWFDN